MAASIRKSFLNLSRLKLKERQLSSASLIRSYTDDSSKKRKTISCLSPDGNTVLFWHTEQKFPYEHSQPMPRNEKEIEEGTSVLKVQYLQEEKLKCRPDGPNDKELANIFYETKHRWFYKPQKKYIKVNPPRDRDGL